MPTYIQKKIFSDIQPSNDNPSYTMTPGTGVTETYSITIIDGAAAENVYFTTIQGQIESDAWESGGSMTVEIRWTAATRMRVRVRIGRISSTGTILQNGTFTAFQLLSGGATKTFSPAVPTWTSAQESCGNRLFVQVQFDQSITGGGNSTATIEVGTTNSEVVSTITEKSATCRRIFLA